MRKNYRNGFTIVELLIVVIIIGILAAAGISKYAGFATEARVRTCLSNQAQITQGMQVWQTKKVQIPKNGRMAGGGAHCWFQSNTGRGQLNSAPAAVRAEFNRNEDTRRDVMNYIDDNNVFRCPENTSKRPTPIGIAAIGSSNAGSYYIYCWFRDYYSGYWSPPSQDSSYTTCSSWGRNNGIYPDGTRSTQHQFGRN